MKSYLGHKKGRGAPDLRLRANQSSQLVGKLQPNITVRKLVTGEEDLALNFLNQRPLENLTLIGFIRDNGIESERNRGSFYGYFCEQRLSGAALIGHHTLLSCDTNAARYFAQIACRKHRSEIVNLLGEKDAVNTFQQIFNETKTGRKIMSSEQEALCAVTRRLTSGGDPLELRQVQSDELAEVSALHAQTYLEWNGVDPSLKDPAGFKQRMLARIEKGRIWIVRDAQGIAFKTDIVSESPEAIYLEGVWTRSDLRETGLGSAAFKQLCHILQQQNRAICLYVSADDLRAVSFYQKIGFEVLSISQLIRYVPAGN